MAGDVAIILEKMGVLVRFIGIKKVFLFFHSMFFWGVDYESEIGLWRSASEIEFSRFFSNLLWKTTMGDPW